MRLVAFGVGYVGLVTGTGLAELSPPRCSASISILRASGNWRTASFPSTSPAWRGSRS